jgi:hypothetical protein
MKQIHIGKKNRWIMFGFQRGFAIGISINKYQFSVDLVCLFFMMEW